MRRLPALVAAVGLNLLELLVLDAARSWARHLGSNLPAVGSVAMVLLLVGAGAVATVTLTTVAQEQADEATLLHVYLRDGLTADQETDLRSRLVADPDVVSVVYVSKDDALRLALQRPGMAALIDQSEGNPLPAGYDVRVSSLPAVTRLASRLQGDPRLAQDQATSYDAASYTALQRLIWFVTAGTLLAVAALALVAAGVTASSIRSAAVARKDEVQTMRLVGASGWMVRGPFVLEGVLTGGLGGAVAGGLMLLLCYLLAQNAGSMLSEVLPGVNTETAASLAASLLPLGAMLGSLSAGVAVRGRL